MCIKAPSGARLSCKHVLPRCPGQECSGRVGTRASRYLELGASPGGSPLCRVTWERHLPLGGSTCVHLVNLPPTAAGRTKWRSFLHHIFTKHFLPERHRRCGAHGRGTDPALPGLTTPGGRTDTKPRHRQPFTAVTGARDTLRCYEGIQPGGPGLSGVGFGKVS